MDGRGANFALLAIVAIVAIVAFVLLFKGQGQRSGAATMYAPVMNVPSNEENEFKPGTGGSNARRWHCSYCETGCFDYCGSPNRDCYERCVAGCKSGCPDD